MRFDSWASSVIIHHSITYCYYYHYPPLSIAYHAVWSRPSPKIAGKLVSSILIGSVRCLDGRGTQSHVAHPPPSLIAAPPPFSLCRSFPNCEYVDVQIASCGQGLRHRSSTDASPLDPADKTPGQCLPDSLRAAFPVTLHLRGGVA